MATQKDQLFTGPTGDHHTYEDLVRDQAETWVRNNRARPTADEVDSIVRQRTGGQRTPAPRRR